MFERRSAAAVILLTAVFVVAGCGSSGSATVTPSAYAKSVCGAIVPFKNDLQKRSSAISAVQSSSSPATRKTALVRFFASAVADSSTAVDRLKAAGTPDVKNGQRIESAITRVFVRLQNAMGSAAARAKSLPTSSLSAFQSSATTLVKSFESSLQGLGTGVSNLKSAELDQAERTEPACKAIAS